MSDDSIIDLSKIDWKIVLGDLAFEAAKRAINDPECKRELKPIVDLENSMLEYFRAEKDKIRDKYKEKHLQKLYAEKTNQEYLLTIYLAQKKH